FTGRYLDTETGLWYFRARYFSDELGRFISRDPLGYVDGMSLYGGYFAMWLTVDPLGLAGGPWAGGQFPGSPWIPGGEYYEPITPPSGNEKIRGVDRIVEGFVYLEKEKKSERIGVMWQNTTTEEGDCLIGPYIVKNYQIGFLLERGYYHEYFLFKNRRTGQYIRDEKAMDGLHRLWGEIIPFSEKSKEKIEVPGTATYEEEYEYIPCPKCVEKVLDDAGITGVFTSYTNGNTRKHSVNLR
ncbi:MAG: RHS repeat-associated core domain-containing protein, partial [Lentisphaeraceae bacterium]|nr:RHS repeat-associated core domain-containing protein [Lentisphaeraceae bacterium]